VHKFTDGVVVPALLQQFFARRLQTGETFRAGLVAAGVTLQTKAFKTATTAADWTATDQDAYRHGQDGNSHDEKGH
jgi:hypothetical protein